jgi:hypothetical protein
MAPRLIHRRRDGLVEIRRFRARDVVLSSDAAVLLGLLAAFFFLVVVLVLALVFDPPFLAVAGWLVLAAAVEHRRARAPRLAAVRATRPPGSAA